MSIVLCAIAKKHGKTLTKHAGDRSDYVISCSALYGVATTPISTCIDQ